MDKKTSILIIIIIVFVAVLGLWGLKGIKKSGPVTPGTNQPTPTPDPKELLPFKVEKPPTDILPDGFVKGFPLEKDATVIVNQSAKTGSGLQSSRTFVSQKTVDENYKIYNDYFKANKWTIITSANVPDFKAISAKNSAGVHVDVTISVNSVSKKVEVSIVFLQPLPRQ